jgi:hypothetical protein
MIGAGERPAVARRRNGPLLKRALPTKLSRRMRIHKMAEVFETIE